MKKAQQKFKIKKHSISINPVFHFSLLCFQIPHIILSGFLGEAFTDRIE